MLGCYREANCCKCISVCYYFLFFSHFTGAMCAVMSLWRPVCAVTVTFTLCVALFFSLQQQHTKIMSFVSPVRVFLMAAADTKTQTSVSSFMAPAWSHEAWPLANVASPSLGQVGFTDACNARSKTRFLSVHHPMDDRKKGWWVK